MGIVKKQHKTDKPARRKKIRMPIWKQRRKKGMLRFLLVEGIVQNAIYLAALPAVCFGIFYWTGREFFLANLTTHLAIAAGAEVLLCLRFLAYAYEEWRLNEKEFEAWEIYESGGDILGLGD